MVIRRALREVPYYITPCTSSSRPVSSIPVGCISDDSFMLDAHVTPMHIMTLSTLCTTLLPHPFTQVCRTQGHCRYPMKGALMASPCSLTPSGFQTSSSSCFAVDFTCTPVFSTVKTVFHLAFSAAQVCSSYIYLHFSSHFPQPRI